uniref:BZIP domain-containing protein n=1 Tax=Steinernema glaseri TaxID=37863 RepID=A0A1I7YQ50_9BILA
MNHLQVMDATVVLLLLHSTSDLPCCNIAMTTHKRKNPLVTAVISAITMSQITSSRGGYKFSGSLGKVMSSLMIVSCLLSVFPYSPSTSPQSGDGSGEIDLEEKRRRNRIKQQKHYQQVKERRKECELKLEALVAEIEQLRCCVEKFEQNAQFLRERDCPFHTPGDVFHFAPLAFEQPDCDEKPEVEPATESPVTPESKKRDKQRRFRKKVDNLEKAIQKAHRERMVSECWSECNKIHLIELNASIQGY